MNPSPLNRYLSVVMTRAGRDFPPLLLALGLAASRRRARHEGQARAVRRPHGTADAVVERREPGRLAAVGRHHVELALSSGAVALGDEREPRAVRRPARLDVAPSGPAVKRRGCPAGRVDDPDVREVLVALVGQGRDDERDPPAVGRDLRIRHKEDSRQILGGHPAAGGHGATVANRSASRASISRASTTAPSPSISPTTAARRRAIRRPSVRCHPSASRAFSH